MLFIMAQEYDYAKPRTSLIIGGSRTKNRTIKGVAQTLAQMGINPAKEIARLAVLSEVKGDLITASTNWRFLQEYVDAKRKAVDPLEQEQRGKAVATLEELQRIKHAILQGTIEAIDESTVIEQERLPESFI